MSQEEVYKILKDLGGFATTKEIREEAKRKFPNLSLHMYVYRRLKKLEKYGFVKRIAGYKKTKWKIVRKYR